MLAGNTLRTEIKKRTNEKIDILVEIDIFEISFQKKSKFWSTIESAFLKIKIVVKNRNYFQKIAKFWSKIEITFQNFYHVFSRLWYFGRICSLN